MDQPAHCGSLQRARRHGASLAQRVRARRCRGVEGDRGARPATGKDRSRAACRRASARSSRRRPAQLDDPAPHGRDRGARGRQDRQVAVVQGVAKKNFRWRRPRHTLKGRQIAAEIERVGLRLQLRKAQAEAGDIILLYGDESEALTHPYLARAWALRGADLRVPAPGQAKKVAISGSLDHVARQLIVHTSQTKRSRDFIAHLEQLDPLFGPQPGRAIKPVVLVEDNGPIHVSKLTVKALEARKHSLAVEWLPKNAPELNDIEICWRELKAGHRAHHTFNGGRSSEPPAASDRAGRLPLPEARP